MNLKIEKNELRIILKEEEKKFSDFKEKGFKLDISRGKPSPDQLSLSNELDGILENNYITEGLDTRNYGQIGGVNELNQIFAQLLSVPVSTVKTMGNSSLSLMYSYILHSYLFGQRGSETAWKNLDEVYFLCPVPGYDRHFAITERFGIKMIPIQLTGNGPDIQEIEHHLASNQNIRGIWCVPKYSNPTGETYSKETVLELVKLAKKTDSTFRIFWDNAYFIHDLEDESDSLTNIYELALSHGVQDKVVQFFSTSKITHAGSGVAGINTSENNLKEFIKCLSFMTIGPDKVNQIRHARFLKNAEDFKLHMRKHKEILTPKFQTVLSTLAKELVGLPFATWSKPNGGYFISLDTKLPVAKQVEDLCRNAGLVLTTVGSTFPLMQDPKNSNIRIAPSYPEVGELKMATELLATCIKIASINYLLNNND